MKITSITTQKNNKNRLSIFLDGEFCCGLDGVTVLRYRLKEGMELSKIELENLQAESESATAFERAIKYLSYASRSKKQIEKYLTEKGYLPQTVNSATEKLIEYRYIDDERYCREYINAHKRREGKRNILFGLLKHGIERELAEQVLSELTLEESSVVDVANKYLRTHKNANKYKLKQYLFSKGFSSEEISLACDNLVNDEQFEVDCDEGSYE